MDKTPVPAPSLLLDSNRPPALERFVESQTLDRLKYIDIGTGARFAKDHGGEFLWDAGRQAWRVWDGRRWGADRTNRIFQAAVQTGVDIIKDSILNNVSVKETLQVGNRGRLMGMLEVAKAHLAVETKDFDADPWLLNLLNGTLDLRTWELRPHRKEDKIMRLAPVEYRPETPDEAQDWPLSKEVFYSFLDDLQPREDMRRFLQEIAGSALPGTDKDKRFYFFHGPRDTGKTTFVNMLVDVLGDYAASADVETFLQRRNPEGGASPTPNVVDLIGRRLVVASEAEEGRKWNAARIKSWTGKSAQSGRGLYKGQQQFTIESTFLADANHKPQGPGNDDAFWSRFLLVEFKDRVPVVKGMGDLLAVPEIRRWVFLWMLEGFRRWTVRTTPLEPPETVAMSTREYQVESNPLREWVDACCTLDASLETPAGALRVSYESWAGSRPTIPPNNRWGDALRALGCEYVPDPNHRTPLWRGIGLKDRGVSVPQSAEAVSKPKITKTPVH